MVDLGRAGVGTMKEMTCCVSEERMTNGMSVNDSSCKIMNEMPIHLFVFRRSMWRANLRGRRVIILPHRPDLPFQPPTEEVDLTTSPTRFDAAGVVEIHDKEPMDLSEQAPGPLSLGSRRPSTPSSSEFERFEIPSMHSATRFQRRPMAIRHLTGA